MVYKDDVKNILESIKDALGLRTMINDSMVESWYRVVRRHKKHIILKAKEELVDSWESRYFPMPKDLRNYLSIAYKEQGDIENDFDYSNIVTSKSISDRAKKLVATSEGNIDRRKAENDKSREKCFKCDKPALMNLITDDYFEYWQHPIIDRLQGKYLCAGHTDELNKFLKETR